MIPALAKKKESIAEYIIHMYQTEDLILNYKLNLDDILEYVIKHMSTDDEILKKLILWYADIIEQMHRENVVETSKRLSSTQYYVDQLTSIHENLIESDQVYQKRYSEAANDIRHHIGLSDSKIVNPIQICLNGIYGMLLLRLNGKKISNGQQSTLTMFGAVLEYLSKVYKKKYPASE